ncbi:hypothetical protein, conserved [Trypanosoma brucei gambiense DAL972]|uniref:Uncharacterized protein n=2 Tax=Trypanosoma brucei TaxID=5691 RepID=A0A3L6L4T0_9TRYP|nr:hypothetical protein, conserved [Trypanosoma brucei gambiense DAL972]RHW70170.1 hypothetical protein DPX39_090016000 [Trypanosoma brucei equiperdum]RHW70237.1 hypothetical protein DPX39_090015600 [Trypanosoma brucei equiperdum]CBH14134.1 hypothetical protein, conserved [Trypanosoma brucei gambiense DAL972]|eukprot:XP_011776405.1 hypothetical protein, conserved [Trypanosoma brucei gambiense DAL972]
MVVKRRGNGRLGKPPTDTGVSENSTGGTPPPESASQRGGVKQTTVASAIKQPASMPDGSLSQDRRKRRRRLSVPEEVVHAVVEGEEATGAVRDERLPENTQVVEPQLNDHDGKERYPLGVVQFPEEQRPWRSARRKAGVAEGGSDEVNAAQLPPTGNAVPQKPTRRLGRASAPPIPPVSTVEHDLQTTGGTCTSAPIAGDRASRTFQAAASPSEDIKQRPHRIPLIIDKGRFSKQKVEAPPGTATVVPMDTGENQAGVCEANSAPSTSGSHRGAQRLGHGQPADGTSGAVDSKEEGPGRGIEEASVDARRRRFMQVPVSRISLYTRLAEGGLDAADRPFVTCVVKHAQSSVSAWVSGFLSP